MNAGEIYNIKLKAELMTLSACQTGLGKISQGEGIIGLTRALLYAGARNLAVSLWKVGDKSTSQLMKNFYSHFLTLQQAPTTHLKYAQFLRQAKLSMLQEKTYSAPYYWSPFVLLGE